MPVAWRTYLVWWTALAVTIAAGNSVVSPARLAAQALVFRHPGAAGPPPDLGIGWVLSVLACVAVLLPLWQRFVVGAGPGARRRELLAAAGLAVVGLVIRLVGHAVTGSEPFGPLSLLPGQLHLVGLGLVVAAVVGGRHRLPTGARSAALGSLLLGVVTTWALVDGGSVATGVWDRSIQALAHLALVAGVVGIVVVSPDREPVLVRRWLLRAAFVGPAFLVFAGPATGVMARQYRERFVATPEGWLLDGPMLPLAMWAVTVALSLTLAVRVVAETPIAGILRDPGRRMPSWSGWVAGIAGGALVWRVITLLTIAPERTDGGDPLFYHATANILAQGRGFPEPLNWIAFGKEIPSALHGPLYRSTSRSSPVSVPPPTSTRRWPRSSWGRPRSWSPRSWDGASPVAAPASPPRCSPRCTRTCG